LIDNERKIERTTYDESREKGISMILQLFGFKDHFDALAHYVCKGFRLIMVKLLVYQGRVVRLISVKLFGLFGLSCRACQGYLFGLSGLNC
jgi:hypothetical protein